MSDINNNSTQFELFPNGRNKEYHPNLNYLQPRTVRLQTEHFVGICIFLIVTNVVCYCLGVRQGREGVLPETTDPKIVADNTKEDVIIVSSVPEKTEVFELPEEMTAAPEPQPERVGILELAVPEEVVVGSKKFTVQVASFKKDTSAQKEATWLKDKGYETFVVRKGDYAIVTVGQFNQAQEAKAFSQRLSQRYKDCLVRRF